MTTLKLVPVDDSLAVIFPDELLTKLGLKLGDPCYLTETADGLRLTKHAPEVEEQLRIGRQIMAERREVLRGLAK